MQAPVPDAGDEAVDPVAGTTEPPPDHMWRVESLRLTVAYETPQPTSLLRDWWVAATGTHPTDVREEPMKGAVQISGRTKDADLQTARAELSTLEVAWAYDRASSELFPAFDHECIEFMARWISFKTLPSIQRLGFAATITRHFSEAGACREALTRLLPAIDIGLTGTNEFQYRINHPCTSQAVEGLAVNRIAEWRIRRLRAAVGSALTIQSDFDMNTDADHVGGLGNLTDLFKELAGFAIRFAREGDRP